MKLQEFARRRFAAALGPVLPAVLSAVLAAMMLAAGGAPSWAEPLRAEPPRAEPSQAEPSSTNRTAEEKALDQHLAADQAVAEGRAVIDSGHVDIGPRFVDGRWRLMIHDGHGAQPVWRHPEDVVLRAGSAALLPVPDDPQYSFVGEEAGREVYVIPQTETKGVVWPGWNTQDPEAMRRLGTGAALSLEKVEGPGRMSLYLENGGFSGPQVLWDSSREQPQEIWAPKNTHTHANWVFTRPGTYFLTVRAHARLADGTEVSDTQRLQFLIGDGDPEDVYDAAARLGDPTAASASGTADSAASDARPSDSGTPASSTAWLVLGGTVLALGAAGAWWGVRGNRARRAASASETQKKSESIKGSGDE